MKFGRAVHEVHKMTSPDYIADSMRRMEEILGVSLYPSQKDIISQVLGRDEMWLKTDYEFGIPMADFTLSVREIRACQFRDELKAYEGKPEQVEKLVKDLVRFYRPELHEAISVVALSFREMMWVITLAHPSFEKLKMCMQPKRYPLIRGEGVCSDAIEIDPPLPLVPSGFDYVRAGKQGWMQTPPEVMKEAREAARKHVVKTYGVVGRKYVFSSINRETNTLEAKLYIGGDPLPPGASGTFSEMFENQQMVEPGKPYLAYERHKEMMKESEKFPPCEPNVTLMNTEESNSADERLLEISRNAVLACCKPSCDKPATHTITGFRTESYACDEHVTELTGVGEKSFKGVS